MKPLELAIFDCDGTLVDSQHTIVQAMHSAFKANGLPLPSHEDVLGIVGLQLADCMRTLVPDAEEDLVHRLVQGYSDAYRANRAAGREEPPLYPHTREILDDLDARGVLLGVATGKSRRGLTHTLAVHDMSTLFVEKRTSDDGPGKPNPTIILDICANLDLPVEHCVMIGDTTYDIEMAVHAGMPAIGVSWGYHRPERLLDAGAYTVLERWTDLRAALQERFIVPDVSDD